MLPVNCGSHTDYQNFVATNLRKYYPNPDALARSTRDIIERFWSLDFSYTDELMADKYSKFGPAPRTPSCMHHSYLLSIAFKVTSLQQSVSKGLINPDALALAGDGTPVVTSARERKHRVCDCSSKGISDCSCDRYFSQPDCDIGWDSSRSCFYHGFDLYMLVASDSESDLPVFPLLNPASRHDSHGFLHAFFRMKSFLPEFHISKLLLDSAHDAMPIYKYCKRKGITLFIDLNEKRHNPMRIIYLF